MSLHHCDICEEPMHQLDSDNGKHFVRHSMERMKSSMTNSPTDTNQASEDELREHLIKKLNTKKRMIEPHDERFVIGFQTEAPGDDVDWQYLDEVIMRFVNNFIRTEKLKLLAEVRELLIDRIPVYDGDDSFGKEYQAGYNSMAHATRTMQLQQSAELAKLEAEL